MKVVKSVRRKKKW